MPDDVDGVSSVHSEPLRRLCGDGVDCLDGLRLHHGALCACSIGIGVARPGRSGLPCPGRDCIMLMRRYSNCSWREFQWYSSLFLPKQLPQMHI